MVTVTYSYNEDCIVVAILEKSKVKWYEIPDRTDKCLLITFLLEAYATSDTAAEIPDELIASFKWLCESEEDIKLTAEDLEEVDASNLEEMANWLKAFIVSSVIKQIT